MALAMLLPSWGAHTNVVTHELKPGALGIRDATQAALVRLGTDKRQAEAILGQAQKTYSRAESLFASRAAGREALGKATETLAIAAAGLSRAEAAIAEGQKALLAAEKTLEYQRARLADAEIRTPFDGLIVRRHRDPGALANRPRVILADEPTAALDSQRGRQVMELFAQVAHD